MSDIENETPKEMSSAETDAEDLSVRSELESTAVEEYTGEDAAHALAEGDAEIEIPPSEEERGASISSDEVEPSDSDEIGVAEVTLEDEEEGEEPPAVTDEIETVADEEVDEAQAEQLSEGEDPSVTMEDVVEEDVSEIAEDEEDEFLEIAEQVPVVEPDDGRLWYVVHCYSGYENKVRHNLEQRIETMGMKDKIFDVVVPTEEEIEIKDGKRRTIERRVFPGYILVQMIMDEDSWYVVRNTPGVTGFVGMGNEPTPLRPEEVTQIVRRMEAEAPRIKVTYKTGQKVRIIDGPFNDFIGTVSDIDMNRAKVRVMVSFFGRETPVELDFLQVEKA